LEGAKAAAAVAGGGRVAVEKGAVAAEGWAAMEEGDWAAAGAAVVRAAMEEVEATAARVARAGSCSSWRI
jgi:hypothetical protein